jgi:hypothetical protein
MMANLLEQLGGREGRSEAFSQFGPQFQDQQNNLIRNLMTQLGSGAQQGFQPIENQARQDFAQKTIPTIAERFNSLGSGGLSSPALHSQQYGAGAQFETGLQALKSQYGMQQNSQLMQLLQLLQPNQAYFGRQPGLFEGAGKGVFESLPAYLAAQRMGGNNQSDQGQEGQGGDWDWQDILNRGGNALLAAALPLGAIPGIGPFLTAGAGLIGGGLKFGSGYASSGQNKNFNAQPSQFQQQLMNLGPTQKYQSPFLGQLDVNQGQRSNDFMPLGNLKSLGGVS